MLQKIAIKNPGCRFCRFYLSLEQWDENATSGVCLYGARQIVQKQAGPDNQKKWKWVDCSYVEERNKQRLCQYFKPPSFIGEQIGQLWLTVRGGNLQERPAYKNEIWWN